MLSNWPFTCIVLLGYPTNTGEPQKSEFSPAPPSEAPTVGHVRFILMVRKNNQV